MPASSSRCAGARRQLVERVDNVSRIMFFDHRRRRVVQRRDVADVQAEAQAFHDAGGPKLFAALWQAVFGRPLHELNIDIICANIPQAKGRVERANGTLQDRLVKEMRLAGISSVEAGNAFLPAFMEDYNRRFSKAPFSDKDLHRPIAEHDDIDNAFAWKEERTVSFNLTLQYDKVLFILEPNEVTRPPARQRVTVFDYPDGRFAIKHKGRSLPCRIFDKVRQVDQAAIIENKRLGPVLAYIADRQKQKDTSRSQKAPRRRGQGKSLFKVG